MNYHLVKSVRLVRKRAYFTFGKVYAVQKITPKGYIELLDDDNDSLQLTKSEMEAYFMVEETLPSTKEKIAALQFCIDVALDSRDKEWFNELTRELHSLTKGVKTYEITEMA